MTKRNLKSPKTLQKPHSDPDVYGEVQMLMLINV